MRIQPGDVIRVIKTNDTLIKRGGLGVVEKIRDGHAIVTFHWTTPWVIVEKGKLLCVNASGGPVKQIPLEWIRPTNMICEYKALEFGKLR